MDTTRAAQQAHVDAFAMGGPGELKVIPRKTRRRNLTCYPEFLSVISCFKKTNLDDSKCQGEIKALNECMTAAVRGRDGRVEERDARSERGSRKPRN